MILQQKFQSTPIEIILNESNKQDQWDKAMVEVRKTLNSNSTVNYK